MKVLEVVLHVITFVVDLDRVCVNVDRDSIFLFIRCLLNEVLLGLLKVFELAFPQIHGWHFMIA